MKSHAPADVPWWGWILIGTILLTQGTWIFLDARKRGARAWFWGLIGLVSCPGSLVLYWLVVRTNWKK